MDRLIGKRIVRGRWLAPCLALAFLPGAGPLGALDAELIAQRAVEAARLAARAPRPPGVVMETLPAGGRYLRRIDLRLEGRAMSGDWGFARHGNAVFAASAAYESFIAENDGRRVVEERAYGVLAASLVVTLDTLSFEFLNPREIRDRWLPLAAGAGGGAAGLGPLGALAAEPVRRALGWLLEEAGVELDERSIRFNERTVLRRDGDLYAALRLDGLSGRRVRITLENGGGPAAIEPLDGRPLGDEEEAFIRQGVGLFDAAFLGDAPRRAGDRWAVPAAVFGSLLGLAFAGEATGEVRLERRPDALLPGDGGRETAQAVLAIDRAGSGPVVFRQEARHGDGYTYRETATLKDLSGTAYFERGGTAGRPETRLRLLEAEGAAEVGFLSRDHLLFQARWEAAPRAKARYVSLPADG